MPTDVRVDVVIERPPAAVAAVMFDPTRDAEWTTGVKASRSIDSGPLRVGSVVERDVAFAGRRFTYRYEVITVDERSLELRVAQPFPMAVVYGLANAHGGTLVSIHARGDARGFFRLVGPFLDWMVRRNIRRDLNALKRLVETRPGG